MLEQDLQISFILSLLIRLSLVASFTCVLWRADLLLSVFVDKSESSRYLAIFLMLSSLNFGRLSILKNPTVDFPFLFTFIISAAFSPINSDFIKRFSNVY